MGFDSWIPIFQGGTQRDSEGREHDGDALIDKAIASFDPAEHEPPAVIGHPVENAPAYGWVEALKKVGNVLHAKFKDMVPEFVDLVKRGLYKKRSAAFYPDGRLRHVGFLGAVPPAVKGLPDVAFSGREGVLSFAFDEQTEGGRRFSEAEMLASVESARKNVEEEVRRVMHAEFAEKARAAAKQRCSAEISRFCEEGLTAGRISVVWLASGLQRFMECLDTDTVVQFAEGDIKRSPFEFFMMFLKEVSKMDPRPVTLH